MNKLPSNCELTAKERKLVENFDEGVRGREFGRLNVRKYTGNNSALRELNGTAKCIGTTSLVREGGRSIWYLYAIDGEKYRIPEPADGIDSILEIEFKRKDV